MVNMEMRIAHNTSTPRRALAGLEDGVSIHGLSDGSWSLIDAVRELLRLTGPTDVVIATWTAAAADLRDAERLLRANLMARFRLCVDRSFLTRQPKYCAAARELFGAVALYPSGSEF